MSYKNHLAFHRDATRFYLPWVLAFFIFLALLAAFAGLFLKELTSRWHYLLGVDLTIELPNEQLPEAGQAAPKIDAVLQAIKEIKGVRRVELIARQEMQTLLKPWLGSAVEDTSLPFPVLIRVIQRPNQKIDFDTFREKVLAISPDAIIDDKADWLGNALNILDRLEVFSWMILALAIMIIACTIVMTSRMALAAHQRTIDIVHLIGAKDSYIARQFQNHALKMVLKGGLRGGLFTVFSLTGILFGLTWQHPSSFGSIFLIIEAWSFVDWLILLLIPIGTALLSAFVARYCILAKLKNS